MENKYRNRCPLNQRTFKNTPVLVVVYEQMFWFILTIDFFVPRNFIRNKKQITVKAFRLYSLSSVVMDFVEPSAIISLFRYRHQLNIFSNGQYGHCLGQYGHFGQNIWCAYQVRRKMVEANNNFNCNYPGFVQYNFCSDKEDIHFGSEHLNKRPLSKAYCRRLYCFSITPTHKETSS